MLRKHGIVYKRPKLVAPEKRGKEAKKVGNYKRVARALLKKGDGGFRGRNLGRASTDALEVLVPERKATQNRDAGNKRAINVFISLDFASGELIHSVHGRRRSREFKYHLKKLMRYARRRRFKRIVLIVGNSPVHRSAESRRFLRKNRRFLKVFNLPKYSPNLNEVEHINM